MIKLENNEILNQYFKNIFSNDKYSHAYLFTGQNEEDINSVVLNFVKAMFCEENLGKAFYCCNNCRICKQIDHNNYVDFYIVDTDEKTIKKEDILAVKEEINLKASFKTKIYWLKNIDKLTPQAANSILKVLEEPEDNIIAILTTTNISMVLDTIISRCQIVNINSDNKEQNYNENYVVINESIDVFLNNFSKNKNISVLNLLEQLKEKENILLFFEILNNKILKRQITPNEDLENLAFVYENILISKKKINSNVAAALVLEKFLFELILQNKDVDFLK